MNEIWTLLFGFGGAVFFLGVLAVCWHNLTAPGPDGACPFGEDW